MYFVLLWLFYYFQVLSAACELEIFDEIHNCAGPVSTSQLCARKGWNEDHTERLLNSCVALKVLEKEVNKEKTGQSTIPIVQIKMILPHFLTHS